MADPAVELRDVHKALGGKQVLNGVALSVSPRELYVIMGGSGSGKTVILKHVVGLLRPDRGAVEVAGLEVQRHLAEVRAKIGYLFQGAALLNSLTVYDNVALPLREAGRLSEGEVHRQVRDRLGVVGLEDAAAKYPDELSGGMRKRAGLARAIVGEKGIFLLDEPTSGLDPAGVVSIRNLIRGIRDRTGATCVVVTHDVPLALALADRIAFLRAGKIHAVGTPQEIRSSQDGAVREFLAGTAAAA